MNVETIVSLLYAAFGCFLAVVHCTDGPKYVHVESESKPTGLTCYKCYRSVHGENCITVSRPRDLDNDTCTENKPYCTVERYIVGNAIATFTRQCSSKCLTGCQRLNEVYVIEKCWECCQDNFCNTGPATSGGTRSFSHFTAGLSTTILLILGLYVTF